jgi:hypothetical protein
MYSIKNSINGVILFIAHQVGQDHDAISDTKAMSATESLMMLWECAMAKRSPPNRSRLLALIFMSASRNGQTIEYAVRDCSQPEAIKTIQSGNAN